MFKRRKKYAIDIWANSVRHIKICTKCHRDRKCLKGVELDCDYKDDDFKPCDKPHYDDDCKDKCDKD